jgi:hypothetical protein
MAFFTFVIIYVAIAIFSYLRFKKWVLAFSGKSEMSNGVWFIVSLAAISMPSFIVNVLTFFVTCVAWLVLLF